VLKKAVAVVMVLLAAVLGYAATLPATFHVQRAARIQAPPERVFALIDDFHAWGAWSPWEKIDPALQRSYSGAPSGEGAAYAWEGNRNIGKGRMRIVESDPPSRIAIELDFLEPFEAHNTAVFTLVGEGDATDVTWAMDGENTYLSKLIGLFFDMDGMIGGNFETGLANLKAEAEESDAKPPAPGGA